MLADSVRHKLQEELKRRLCADDVTDEELDRIEKELAEDDARLEKIEKELAAERERRERAREAPLRQLAALKKRAERLMRDAWRRQYEATNPPAPVRSSSIGCSVVLETDTLAEPEVSELVPEIVEEEEIQSLAEMEKARFVNLEELWTFYYFFSLP
jgi:hypothetical protein